MINGVKYLVRIDNLDAKIKIVSSDMEKARKILKHFMMTIFVSKTSVAARNVILNVLTHT
jgi:hypothetical protein